MPRRDLPCAGCGKLMQRSRTSAPEGVAKCRPCRELTPAPWKGRKPSVTDWACAHCGEARSRPPTKGQRPKYCGEACATAASELRRLARLIPRECAGCESAYVPTDYRQKFCSASCSNRARDLAPRAAPPAPCSVCLGPGVRGRRTCSDDCLRRLSVSQMSPVNRALAEGDLEALLAALEGKSHRVGECMKWAGRLRDGYPAGQLHRRIAEAVHGAPLGSQAAHHACGNSWCVNPAHIQPVTAASNVAEMLARRSYEDRIAELEEALRSVSPDNPVLNRVPLGGAPGQEVSR